MEECEKSAARSDGAVVLLADEVTNTEISDEVEVFAVTRSQHGTLPRKERVFLECQADCRAD